MIAKLDTEGQCKILHVGGRIDFESALDFEQQINSMIQQEGDCFIVELSQVELLSSAGLRVLLSTAKRVSHRDASLGLAAPSQVVRQVFEISHFNLLFKIFPSVAEAIAALKGRRHETEAVALPEVSTSRAADTEKTAPAANKPPPLPGTGAADAQAGQTRPPAPAAVPPPAAGAPVASEPPTAPPMPPPRQPAPAAAVGGPQPPAVPKAPVPPPLPPTAESMSSRGRTVTPPQVPKPDAPLPPGSAGQTALPVSRSQSPPSSMEGARDRLAKPEAAAPKTPEPPALAAAETAVPITRPPQPPPLLRKQSVPAARLEAFFPARLEVRAEGNSYPCRDGDVIGSAGQLARGYFSQIPGLAPRHLLIGKLEGRWFVFTPQNVQHPFLFDGHSLVAGERKFLQYAEHQIEFNGRVFGLRLTPEPEKRGWFSRIFGKK